MEQQGWWQMDRKTVNSKNFKSLGLSILEALVATLVVGIGFVAVFQMVNYSAVSINTSAERTKTNFLIDMIAEDLVAERKFVDGSGELLHATDSLVDKIPITGFRMYRDDGEGGDYIHVDSLPTSSSLGLFSDNSLILIMHSIN